MAFIDHVLQAPSYGWKKENGELVVPTHRQIIQEFFSRMNIFKDIRNWLPLMSWVKVVAMVPFLCLFIFKFFTWPLFAVAFVYSMVIMGTHGTVWHHRYCTHQAYKFKNGFWRFVTQNLTISMIPEEIYVISHHVHHAKSDQPGDPYNAKAGFLYCFLADVNHQPIAKDLNENDYDRVKLLMKHTGVKANTYKKYVKWGSYVSPAAAMQTWVFNWSFWYLASYLVGGHALACCMFASAGFWAVGVRTFNYEGHGKGKNLQVKGVDFNTNDNSINQIWPGIVAGEWHNNHHLYPGSARSGFKPYQVDLAWYYIKFLYLTGAVTTYKDSKKDFIKKYHLPGLHKI